MSQSGVDTEVPAVPDGGRKGRPKKDGRKATHQTCIETGALLVCLHWLPTHAVYAHVFDLTESAGINLWGGLSWSATLPKDLALYLREESGSCCCVEWLPSPLQWRH